MLRTYADQVARQYGMTRAQWAVLKRLERNQGLKQSELAEMLDLQPITLTRLVDRLCENGLIERRADPNDRRAKRLFLTEAAQPLMDRLEALGRQLMESILAGRTPEETDQAIEYLGAVKENLRRLLQDRSEQDKTEQDSEKRYA